MNHRCAVTLVLALLEGGCTERVIVDDWFDDGPAPSNDVPPGCGDGVARGAEACDGSDLRGATCESLGLGSGVLTCEFDCQTIVTEGCTATGCGNAVVEPGEVCDGPELGGQSCESLGLSAGTLACDPQCTSFDLSGCGQDICGNGALDGDEVCDGADLGGVTCTDVGREPGRLTCTPDCLGYDVLGCGDDCSDSDLGSAVGAAVAGGDTSTDDDDLPQECGGGGGGADHVLRFVPPVPGEYVLDTFGSNYDTALSVYGSCSPASLLMCNDDAAGNYQSQVSPLLDVERQVFVSVDGFGQATGQWVLNITPPPIPDVPACAEEDLGWATGSPVTQGDTTFEDDDVEQSCGAGPSQDHVIRFIAPATGLYVLDTSGSAYDTVLSLHDGCAPGQELACNDDYDSTDSRLDVELVAGRPVLVVIGGFSGNTGSWVLRIDPP